MRPWNSLKFIKCIFRNFCAYKHTNCALMLSLHSATRKTKQLSNLHDAVASDSDDSDEVSNKCNCEEPPKRQEKDDTLDIEWWLATPVLDGTMTCACI